MKVLNRRILLSVLLLEASAWIAARVPMEYDVQPINGGGPIYLPSIQLNDAPADIDRKSAVSNEVHSQQRCIGVPSGISMAVTRMLTLNIGFAKRNWTQNSGAVPAAFAPENVAEPIGVIPLMSIRLELITVLPAPVSKSATILLPIGGKDVARVSGSKEYTSNLAAASSALAPFDGRKNPFTTGIHFL
jgi:hypothetical protein